MLPFEIFVVAPLLAYNDIDFSPDVVIEPAVISKTPWLYTPVTFLPSNSIVPVFVPFATSAPFLGWITIPIVSSRLVVLFPFISPLFMISPPFSANKPIPFLDTPLNKIFAPASFLATALFFITVSLPTVVVPPSELFATIPIFCSPLVILIVPLFIAVGNNLVAVSSVATVPKSALIPIFLEPVTFILPAVSLVILSLALLIKTIPVLPSPPETLIVPLFKTFPV